MEENVDIPLNESTVSYLFLFFSVQSIIHINLSANHLEFNDETFFKNHLNLLLLLSSSTQLKRNGRKCSKGEKER